MSKIFKIVSELIFKKTWFIFYVNQLLVYNFMLFYLLDFDAQQMVDDDKLNDRVKWLDYCNALFDINILRK